MASKRKSESGGSKKSKKNKQNGKKDEADFSDDFDDESSSGAGSEPEAETYDDDLDPSNSALRVKGPEHAGALLICGAVNWDLSGRKQVPKGTKPSIGRNLYVPHRFTPFEGIKVKLVVSGSSSCHSIIVTEEGKAFTFGRNEKSQLGNGNQTRQDSPVQIETLKDHTVVGAATGRNHSIFLTDRGTVYTCGDNTKGQCGVGSSAAMITTATRIRYKGPPIVKVSAGAEFSVILDVRGTMHSFGSPEYGQLGHGSTGEYIATQNKISFHFEKAPKPIIMFVEKSKESGQVALEPADILDVSCGANHTVCIDSKKRVFSWGFGGYGRLGHAEPKDEFVPRLIKLFSVQNRAIKSIHCGSSYCLAVTEHGAVYFWGQTKKTGEAVMYPKPIQDLHGWNVRSVGTAQTSIVVAADESCIAWGPSPAYGELGLGENRKTAPAPTEVKKLDGIHIHQLTCGYSHTLFIARQDSEEEQNKLENLPEYNP